ncbi:HDOD domain-containing protein [Horticoccus sp. 23ND18S-11]|uniref:HDOD domain-containing protein n=1 Tax=Horticoccus sp. 23ND18S-11 TaxID=3391832 RepID=UPI0039C943F7
MKAGELIARVRHLRSPSPSVTRLVAMLSSSETGNDEIVQVVRQDGVLCAKLLALCNSAALGGSSIGSVEQAIFYLGYREVYRLVLSLGFGAALAPALPGYAMEPGALWRHSLLTAYITDPVLEALPAGGADASFAYTAGLVHDIGKIVLDHALDAVTKTAIREQIERDHCALIEAERDIIGSDHAEVGARLLESWRLPSVIVEAVANHHAPALLPRPRLSAVVHVADMLAHQVGAAPGWASYAVRAGEEAVEALGFTNDTVQNLLIASSDALARVETMAVAA